MARRTTPHSTPHDAAASSYGPKTALAWREEGERRRGQEPDSTCVTDLSIWSAERSKQVGETHIHLIQPCSRSHRQPDLVKVRLGVETVRGFCATLILSASPCSEANNKLGQVAGGAPSTSAGCMSHLIQLCSRSHHLTRIVERSSSVFPCVALTVSKPSAATDLVSCGVVLGIHTDQRLVRSRALLSVCRSADGDERREAT